MDHEQISEDFFKELHNKTFYTDYSLSLKEAKQKGYIKQSRKEEIKSKLDWLYKRYKDNYADNFPKDIEDYITTMTNIKNLQKELIEILDNKEK
jgi:CO dehydrogenase/acetyl-CoA synthase beta subunit